MSYSWSIVIIIVLMVIPPPLFDGGCNHYQALNLWVDDSFEKGRTRLTNNYYLHFVTQQQLDRN